jgi:hypothetical protein
MRDAWLIARVDRLTEGDVTGVLEPLKFLKIIDRYKHRCRLPVLRQHNTFMAVPGTLDQLGEMTAGLRNRTRERHPSNVQVDADGRQYGAPTTSRAPASRSARRRIAPGSVTGCPQSPTSWKVCGPVLRRALRGRGGRAARADSTPPPASSAITYEASTRAVVSVGRDAGRS